MIENLNKEKFWNGLQQQYPEAVDAFCKWIDAYKTEVGWNNLFGEHETKQRGQTVCCGFAPKFHDIPLEMQLGIVLRFVHEMTVKDEPFEEAAKNVPGEVADNFEKIQALLNPKKPTP